MRIFFNSPDNINIIAINQLLLSFSFQPVPLNYVFIALLHPTFTAAVNCNDNRDREFEHLIQFPRLSSVSDSDSVSRWPFTSRPLVGCLPWFVVLINAKQSAICWTNTRGYFYHNVEGQPSITIHSECDLAKFLLLLAEFR